MNIEQALELISDAIDHENFAQAILLSENKEISKIPRVLVFFHILLGIKSICIV